MKRKVITFLFIVFAFILQSTVFDTFSFANIKPNLLIIVTSAFGFMRGRKEGMAVGFISGLFVDAFWGGLIGFYALLYAVIGYVNGTFHRLFYEDDIKLPILLIGASDLICSLIIYVCMFLLRGKFIFLFFLKNIMLPEFVYTILITVVLYQLILFVNRKLETEEQRSASKFV